MSVSPVSVSVAVTTAPTLPAVETAASPTVSVKARVVLAPSVKVGLALPAVLVVPLPGPENGPSPSSFTASTCTW